jgi:uncharacterized SAM-binding protein YcdF (DUF218 family)
MPTTSRRRLFLAVLIVAPLIIAVFAFRQVGGWLAVEDPLQRTRAIVVLGGDVPFRAMEGARLYKDGWAAEVWLTQGGVVAEEVALTELGIQQTREHVYSGMVLERLGVPAAAIRVLPERNRNTADEMRSVEHALQQLGEERVILVTSAYHARRVRFLWHKLVGGHPEAIVRYTPDEPFDPQHWWRDAADGLKVARECFGLVNAAFGFPIKSEHW